METEPQREPKAEIPLLGGQLTPGIVRVGNTVRRPAKGNAAFVPFSQALVNLTLL